MRRTGSATGKGHDIERYAPWLVLFIFLAITFLLWQNAHRASLQQQQIEFDSGVNVITDRIHRRIAYYEQLLHGVRAFYLNQREMERSEFSGYVASLGVEENFPGTQGISFAPLLSDAAKAAHVRMLRRAGLPDYDIKPPGRRRSYAPVAYIEPMNERNARVLGFDNLSNPARRATVEQARDEDAAVISEKLVLQQEDGQDMQAGFLMFLPVYRRGAAHDTPAARRQNIDGWFAASFRMDNLMGDVLGEHAEGIGLAIFDGAEISEQSRMYGTPASMNQSVSPLFREATTIDADRRIWSVQFFSLPEFESRRDTSTERNAALAGGITSLLLAFITWLLMRDRMRAIETTAAIRRELEMRKQAEHKTHDLYMFNEAVLEKSPAGIALYLASGPCIMANEAYARSIGGTVEEVLKQDFRSSESWRRNGLVDFANQAFETWMTIRRDIGGVTSFGKKVVVECIFAPINISNRPHLMLIVNDVSDRAEAKRALTESMRKLEEKELAKTRFLAAAGHDLRQPVAAASLFIDALKLTEPTLRQNEIIQRLDQSMATFNGLLEALLNVSKLDAGMIKPEFSLINVSEVFNWLEQNFAPMANNKHLAFRLYFPMKESLLVRSDQGLLKSVLMNLVSNAIKFTAKGAVLISARRRGANVLFQVWDTGMGIPVQHIKHIFDEFYQVGNPQRDRSGGLGLGLSIARRAMTLLGVEVSCRSQSGRGSVFEFSLPSNDALSGAGKLPAAASAPRGQANMSFARGKRFVLAEDDVLVVQGMLNWLEGMGAEVKCFHSAEDALRHASIDHADFYIADYMLGGTLNGIEFLNLVRQKAGRPIKAVVVTGDTSSAFIRHAVDCDWPVLHKPINTSQLIASLSAQARDSNASS